MPISISGSGTITGISTGGLPDGCISTDDLANNAVTAGKMGATEQSRLCAAFVNFNGTGTVAIRASYNVSSITDNGVGDYTVNFTTAMADANYAFTVGYRGAANNDTDFVPVLHTGSSPSATAARFVVNNMSTGSLADIDYVCISFFR
jgi:hypothetical protein